MRQKSKYWNQISMRADYGILEIASAYLSHISLGIIDKNTERIFFFDTNRIEDAEKIINELNKKYAIEFSHKKIYDDDWHLKWKDNFTPIFIDDEVVIVPDWDNQIYDCKYVVKININGIIWTPTRWHRACKNVKNDVLFSIFEQPFLLKDRTIGSSKFSK